MADKRTGSRSKRHAKSIPAELIDSLLDSPLGQSLNDKLRQVMGLPGHEISPKLKAEAKTAAEKLQKDMQEKSPYRVLGVDPSMSFEDIKIVFKGLQKKYHPDGKQPNEQKSKELNKAYEEIARIRNKPK